MTGETFSSMKYFFKLFVVVIICIKISKYSFYVMQCVLKYHCKVSTQGHYVARCCRRQLNLNRCRGPFSRLGTYVICSIATHMTISVCNVPNEESVSIVTYML